MRRIVEDRAAGEGMTGDGSRMRDDGRDMTFDDDNWNALITGRTCPMCGEPDHRLLLTTLPSGRVILQDDGDFPGYCVLEHRRHVTELYELGEPERNQLMRDIARVARAIG